jgi:serine/threonine protein kinase
MSWSPPELIDEIRLLRPLGRGAMGQVHLGHDTLLDRPVAVKFLGTEETDATLRERLLAEARAVARLNHPNVVTVYRVGEVAGHPFMVSELVNGQSLDWIKKPLPWKQALDIGVRLVRGLGAAHRLGVLHRDIKPANIMLLPDGEVKLIDFGVAQLSAVERNTPSQPPAGGPGESAPEPFAGTPLYAAPEVRQGAPATRRSEIYAVGAVLYELCAGYPPHYLTLGGADLSATTYPGGDGDGAPERDEAGPADDGSQPAYEGPEPEAPPLHQVAPDADPLFCAIVDRCLRDDPEQRFATCEELWDALEELRTAAPADALPAGNPYPGLHPFDADHRTLFFGRASEVRTLVERLRTEPLVLLAGDSGVGKTSLCRAGVLPLLHEGALEEGKEWSVVAIIPGRRPLLALAAALCEALGTTEEGLISVLGAEPEALGPMLRRAARGTVLFIDHLEELFTIADPGEAAALAGVLGHLTVLTPGVRVLLSVRGDFLTRLLSLPGLGVEVSRALHLLRPLSAEQLREAIVGPARRLGVRFESEAMIDRLVQSAVGTGGGLPLLQFALAELWEARDKQVIPEAALLAMGEVSGALARHADGVLARLPPDQRQASRRLLTRLVLPEGGRARRTRAELCLDEATASAALEALVHGRLIMAREGDGDTAYELAHDALCTEWATLRSWLDAGAETRAARQRIQAAAAEWERLGRSPDALWGERRLKEVAFVDVAELWPREVAFLHASRRAARRRLWGRAAAAIFAVALALSTAPPRRCRGPRSCGRRPWIWRPRRTTPSPAPPGPWRRP